MGQVGKVLLTINKIHSTAEGPRLWTRLRWVKPGLWLFLVQIKYIFTLCSPDGSHTYFPSGE